MLAAGLPIAVLDQHRFAQVRCIRGSAPTNIADVFGVLSEVSDFAHLPPGYEVTKVILMSSVLSV